MEGPEKIMDAEEYLQPQQAVDGATHGPVPHQTVQMNGKLDKVGYIHNPNSQGRLAAAARALPPTQACLLHTTTVFHTTTV